MAALIHQLDTFTPTQLGENSHVEYGWSNDIRENIAQFYFQLNRTKDTKGLEEQLKNILSKLKYYHSQHPGNQVTKEYITLMYKMIAHTRDIVEGKGEYNLTYMMIQVWYSFFPELALFALKTLVKIDDENQEHPYGSWKDIKYFCKYFENNPDHPLFMYGILLMNNQLKQDHLKADDISLAAKWVPREKSNKFGWLFEHLAKDYFNNYLETARTPESYKKAVLKCKTDYRKLISTLNKELETLQIKQCGQSWSSIDFNKCTSISMSKQKNAFMNVDKIGKVRYEDNNDRILCAEHFKGYIEDAKNGQVNVKGKRIGMVDFVKQALEFIQFRQSIGCNQTDFMQEKSQLIDLLNMQWSDNSTQNQELGNMIAMVDVSGSMSGDPMNAAIALGIRIAEKSKLGKRIMTFSSCPTWVNLDHKEHFVDMVEEVSKAHWGMNTNFSAALEMILDAIIRANLHPDEVQNMMLVILSDMQMDCADTRSTDTLYRMMKMKYEAAGMRSSYKKPYKPPHIIFWNLRSTNGFPVLSSQPNTSMMSGFSPVLLNTFCEKGMEALQSATPWSILESVLSNKRYDIMQREASKTLELY